VRCAEFITPTPSPIEAQSVGLNSSFGFEHDLPTPPLATLSNAAQPYESG
jgi:hypothetical protein